MKTHVIGGKTYAEVDRIAEIGELVVYTFEGKSDAIAREVLDVGVSSVDVEPFIDKEDGEQCYGFAHGAYRVLEPVADVQPVELTANDIRWQPDKVIDLLANLTRRLSALERALERRDQQIDTLFGNVQRQGEEIAEVSHKVEETTALAKSNESDIVMLDERTQPKTHVSKAFPSNAKLLAEAFEALAKYEKSVER